MNAVGTHLILEFQRCNPEILNDLERLKHALITAAQEVGATIVGESFHQFNPHGVTGVIAIAESHLCIHTWPEYAYAAVDIFTCGTSVEPRRAIDILVERLESKEHSVLELKRGPRSHLAAVAPSMVQS